MKIIFSSKEKTVAKKIGNYLLSKLWIISTIGLFILLSFSLVDDNETQVVEDPTTIDSLNSRIKRLEILLINKTNKVKISNKISLSKEDKEILNLLVYTETTPKAKNFEYQLVLECIMLRYFESGEKSLKNYVVKNPMVFQGWLNKKDYYNALKGSWWENGKKISCPDCQERTKLVSNIVKSRINTGSPRPVKYYHRTDLKSVSLNGSKKNINWKHIRYVENQAKDKKLVKIDEFDIDLIHHFYELPLDLVPKGYFKWRQNIMI